MNQKENVKQPNNVQLVVINVRKYLLEDDVVQIVYNINQNDSDPVDKDVNIDVNIVNTASQDQSAYDGNCAPE